MSQRKLSVNDNSLRLVKKILENPDRYSVAIEETKDGAKIIDAGIEAEGGYEAGKAITEICLGGYGHVDIATNMYDDVELPSVHVRTDHPAIAALGSQFAGWRIKVGAYQAIGSGPARALALKPKNLYEKIDYSDHSDSATIVLETSTKPSHDVLEYISKECNVSLDKLYVLLAPTSSLSGSVQISGRIVETGLHKLMEVGFDPRKALSGYGYAPIAPTHPKFMEAMGRTNDMILYGGVVHFTVDWDDEEALTRMVDLVPSSKSKDYGKLFAAIFKSVGHDFYKIDPALFAPAVITVNNIKTGRLHKAGQVNVEVLKQTIQS